MSIGRVVLVIVSLIAAAGAGCGAGPSPSNASNSSPLTPAGRKEFVFKGKVDAVDPVAKTLTVINENV